jgi:hypothetical protein
VQDVAFWAAYRDPGHRGRDSFCRLRIQRPAHASKAQVMALAAGDSWLDQGANILSLGRPAGVI